MSTITTGTLVLTDGSTITFPVPAETTEARAAAWHLNESGKTNAEARALLGLSGGSYGDRLKNYRSDLGLAPADGTKRTGGRGKGRTPKVANMREAIKALRASLIGAVTEAVARVDKVRMENGSDDDAVKRAIETDRAEAVEAARKVLAEAEAEAARPVDADTIAARRAVIQTKVDAITTDAARTVIAARAEADGFEEETGMPFVGLPDVPAHMEAAITALMEADAETEAKAAEAAAKAKADAEAAITKVIGDMDALDAPTDEGTDAEAEADEADAAEADRMARVQAEVDGAPNRARKVSAAAKAKAAKAGR